MRQRSEERRSPRKQVLLRAVITDCEGQNETWCAVRDVSRTGCRIICWTLDEFPDVIRIKLDLLSFPIDGRIIWRRGTTAGVELRFPDNRSTEEVLVEDVQ